MLGHPVGRFLAHGGVGCEPTTTIPYCPFSLCRQFFEHFQRIHFHRQFFLPGFRRICAPDIAILAICVKPAWGSRNNRRETSCLFLMFVQTDLTCFCCSMITFFFPFAFFGYFFIRHLQGRLSALFSGSCRAQKTVQPAPMLAGTG